VHEDIIAAIAAAAVAQPAVATEFAALAAGPADDGWDVQGRPEDSTLSNSSRSWCPLPRDALPTARASYLA
jgi:hypothetical protein